jgi:hypothetical protein
MFNEIPGDSSRMEKVRVSENLGTELPTEIHEPDMDLILNTTREALLATSFPDDIEVPEEKKKTIFELTAEEFEDADLDADYPAIKVVREQNDIDRKLIELGTDPESVFKFRCSGMLCVFRCYSFQVCGMNGTGDYGSSRVKDLPAICRENNDETACRLMAIEAKEAARRFGAEIDEDDPVWKEFILKSVVFMRQRRKGGFKL